MDMKGKRQSTLPSSLTARFGETIRPLQQRTSRRSPYEKGIEKGQDVALNTSKAAFSLNRCQVAEAEQKTDTHDNECPAKVGISKTEAGGSSTLTKDINVASFQKSPIGLKPGFIPIPDVRTERNQSSEVELESESFQNGLKSFPKVDDGAKVFSATWNETDAASEEENGTNSDSGMQSGAETFSAAWNEDDPVLPMETGPPLEDALDAAGAIPAFDVIPTSDVVPDISNAENGTHVTWTEATPTLDAVEPGDGIPSASWSDPELLAQKDESRHASEATPGLGPPWTEATETEPSAEVVSPSACTSNAEGEAGTGFDASQTLPYSEAANEDEPRDEQDAALGTPPTLEEEAQEEKEEKDREVELVLENTLELEEYDDIVGFDVDDETSDDELPSLQDIYQRCQVIRRKRFYSDMNNVWQQMVLAEENEEAIQILTACGFCKIDADELGEHLDAGLRLVPDRFWQQESHAKEISVEDLKTIVEAKKDAEQRQEFQEFCSTADAEGHVGERRRRSAFALGGATSAILNNFLKMNLLTNRVPMYYLPSYLSRFRAAMSQDDEAEL